MRTAFTGRQGNGKNLRISQGLDTRAGYRKTGAGNHGIGFQVEPHRIVTETISGSVAISQRPEFARLADRLEPGDVLAVTKLKLVIDLQGCNHYIENVA